MRRLRLAMAGVAVGVTTFAVGSVTPADAATDGCIGVVKEGSSYALVGGTTATP